MNHIWNCLPKQLLWYYKKKLFSNVWSSSKVDITDHCHLYSFTFTQFEVVGPNHSWEIARMSYFHTCALWTMWPWNDLWPLPLSSTSTQKWAWYQERPKGYLYQIWTCLVESETRYRSMPKSGYCIVDRQMNIHDGIRSFGYFNISLSVMNYIINRISTTLLTVYLKHLILLFGYRI